MPPAVVRLPASGTLRPIASSRTPASTAAEIRHDSQDPADGETQPVRRVGETEFIFLMALISAMAALAIDMLLPAFSGMRRSFGLAPDATDLSLTITLFFVGSGVGNLVYGPLADAWGRKPVLVSSLGLYGAAAMAAALAPSLTLLLVARFVWGFAAGGPRVLTQAIVRDRFSGDAMARVMSAVQAAFFIGPVVAPIIGAGLVSIGSWRWVMGFGVVTAALAAVWSLRLQETLPPHRRRPLTARSVGNGLRIVVTNRRTLFLTMALTFISGAFFSFLGSSELVFSSVFGQGHWFVTYFAVMGLFLGIMSLGINRLLKVVPARRITLTAGATMMVLSAVLLVVILSTDGHPPFLVWLVLFSLSNMCAVAMFPSIYSLALDPMGELAGTAASVIGFITAVTGAGLAALTDRSIEETVLPLAVAYLIYSSISYLFQLTALRSGLTVVDPEAGP